MARKPKEMNHSPKENTGTFDEQSFVDGVFNDEYILVVGSGVILDRAKFPQTDGDINRYILNEINDDRREEIADFIDHKDFTDVIRATPSDKQDPIYSLLADGFDYELSDISPELTQLLRSKLFKFVLTTTIDGYVEALMHDIWGDELRIVNISDNHSLKDFQTALETSRVNKYEQPTLFYVFGKVVKGREKPKGFMETDVDAIRYIEKWMKDLDNRYIVPFLKKKRILALGCKFDDWYFRFFWYILTRGFNDAEREGAKDTDGSILTRDNLASMFNPDDPADQHLKEYLRRRGVCMHDDVWLFMNHIYTLLTSIGLDSPFRKLILEKRRMGEIFISYKSNSDVLYASELFCKLAREKQLNVWFDNISLDGGAAYEEKIPEAIKKAKIFIPILSPAVAKDMIDKGEQISTYYSKEWRWAAENKQVNIMPITIGGYSIKSPYHQVFKNIINPDKNSHRKTTVINMDEKANCFMVNEKNGFAKLLDSIYKQLGVTEP